MNGETRPILISSSKSKVVPGGGTGSVVPGGHSQWLFPVLEHLGSCREFDMCHYVCVIACVRYAFAGVPISICCVLVCVSIRLVLVSCGN